MRPLTREEHRDTIDAFAIVDDVPKLPAVDRSTAEHWGTCPWQAKAIENGMGRVMPNVVEAGEQIHQAFGRVTQWYIESASEIVTKGAIVQELEDQLRQSRPDLTPEVIAGARASIWAWASFIHGIDPNNILGFDGGVEIGRSGQIAWEYPHLHATLTTELDLLVSTESQELLRIYDYKTGHGIWTAEDVASSFQFQFQAALVLRNYEDVQAVEVVVWNTRTNGRTFRVTFHRRDLATWETRISEAMKYRYLHGSDDCPPTWPTQEKCAMCPVAMLCPSADEPLKDLTTDEGERRFVDQMISAAARLAEMEKLASARADALGRELVGSSGSRFGRNKPSTDRRKPAALYSVKAKAE